tara:strand:- start:1216 stop:1482 length:267 start_codon:yes stop_codon:yes gene_type:complete
MTLFFINFVFPYLSPFIFIGLAVYFFKTARRDVKRGYHESVTKIGDSNFIRTKHAKGSFHFLMWVGGSYVSSLVLIIFALILFINWFV